MKPISHSACIKLEPFTQFRDATCNPADGDNSIPSCISRLFFWCRPTAIRFFITATLIGVAINAFPRWAFSHVFKEIAERKPPLTNLNATRSVLVESRMLRVCATLNHIDPTQKCVRLFANRMAVQGVCTGSHLTLKAATRLSMSVSQRAIIYGQLVSTIANDMASPARFTGWPDLRLDIGNYEKSCEAFSDQRDSFWHERFYLNFQRLCKWWALDGNRRSLRQWSQINSVCQEIV